LIPNSSPGMVALRARWSRTIHVLEGEVTFSALGREYPLASGDILVLAPGVEHSARSELGGLFLLTVRYLGHNTAEDPLVAQS
jgi:quercetin dioxygenase-like cupin family protein